MRKVYFLISIAWYFFLFTPCIAQPQLSMGINNSTLTHNNENYHFENKTGIAIEFGYNIQLNEKFHYQFGIGHTNAGVVFDDASYRINYLSVPKLVKYNFSSWLKLIGGVDIRFMTSNQLSNLGIVLRKSTLCPVAGIEMHNNRLFLGLRMYQEVFSRSYSNAAYNYYDRNWLAYLGYNLQP